MTDPDKSFWKNMQAEPSKELSDLQQHHFFFVIAVITPAKTNAGGINIEQPVVADCCLMRIPAKIFHYLNGSTKGFFGIYHPLVFIKFSGNYSADNLAIRFKKSGILTPRFRQVSITERITANISAVLWGEQHIAELVRKLF